ncbi:hypothetical protein [Flavobacterium sp. W21_SRS_FM6]|uniref:hypothetical protein n=1 Tax=Flavobacterium sp. W21_SRS_FM6 TaxID=3240268 RepID=UPI003F8DA42A
MLVSIYFSYKRLKSKKAIYKFTIMGLNVIAAVALMLLLTEVQISQQKLSKAWLLTAGHLSEVNRKTIQDAQGEDPAYVLQGERLTPAIDSSNMRQLSHLSQLADWQPRLQQLTVVGDGLSAEQWQSLVAQFPELLIEYVPSEPISGLLNMSWPRHPQLGAPITISGQLFIADKQDAQSTWYKLSLLDPTQQTLQSHTLRNGDDFEFTLPAQLAGNWHYEVQVYKSAEQNVDDSPMISETIALSVESPQPFNLLIYQSAPSFETRNVKDWATAFNAAVSVVSQISKTKHLVQHYNYADKPSATFNLNNKTLSSFDLMLMDGRAYNALESDQKKTLHSAVEQGLGLLILADASVVQSTAQPNDELLSRFSLSAISPVQKNEVFVKWAEQQPSKALDVQPFILETDQGQTWVTTTQGQALVSSVAIGKGYVALSLINSSYQWQLSGASEHYSQFWQYLSAQLATTSGLGYWLEQARDSLPIVQQRMSLCALTTAKTPFVKQTSQLASLHGIQRQTFPLARAPFQTEKYCGQIWPDTSTWLRFSLYDGAPQPATEQDAQTAPVIDEQYLYVYQADDWQAWQQQRKQRASLYQAKRSQALTAPRPTEQSEALNKRWSLLVFLLACTALWIERKQFVSS